MLSSILRMRRSSARRRNGRVSLADCLVSKAQVETVRPFSLNGRGNCTHNRLQRNRITLFNTASFSGDLHGQQLATQTDWDGKAHEASKEEQTLDRNIKILSVSLACTAVGSLFSPWVALLGLPGLVFYIGSLCRRGIQTLHQERRFGIAALDAIAVPAILLSGHFFITACACMMICVAEKLKIRTRENSEKSIIDIFENHVTHVWILREGIELSVPIETLEVGDTVVVDAGQMIPIDGLITEGFASIDQRMLTGESQPTEKEVGDNVFASTVLIEGRISIRVEKMGTETVAAQIGEILLHTTDFKSTIQAKGEEIADRLAVGLFGLGVVALPVAGAASALAVLNAPLIDTLRMAAPLSLLSFLQLASRQGILVKDGRALELLKTVDTIVFDKTGTLTQEQPTIGALSTCGSFDENELLSMAASAEQKQSHPIARAILQAAHERGVAVQSAAKIKYEIGFGIRATLKHQTVLVGSERFMERADVTIPSEIRAQQIVCNERGYSLVYVAVDKEFAGTIELQPTIRPESKMVIRELQKRGLTVYIISGDHQEPTKNLAEQLGIEHYFAETLPEEKAEIISQLQDAGRVVCFVGDGINDSIALKKSNVSISLRGASTIALDTAEVVLMNEDLRQIVDLLDLAERYNRNMKVNLATAIAPGVIVVAGAFVFHFGIVSCLIGYNVGMLAGLSNAMLPLLKKDGPK